MGEELSLQAIGEFTEQLAVTNDLPRDQVNQLSDVSAHAHNKIFN